MEKGDAKGALARLTKCIEQDDKRDHITPSFKYFALGKVYFRLGDHAKAKDALIFAMKSSKSGQSDDFIVELLAKTLLALENPQKALELIQTVPEKMRRPYFRWTEADILCSLNRFKEAEHALVCAVERDMLSKHKTLIRLAKLYYLQRNFQQAEQAAANSVRFFRQQWSKSYNDGLFWQALSTFRMGRKKEAEDLAMELKMSYPYYPKLGMLIKTIKEG